MFPAMRNNETSLTCQIRVGQVSAYCRIVLLDMKFDVKVATACLRCLSFQLTWNIAKEKKKSANNKSY